MYWIWEADGSNWPEAGAKSSQLYCVPQAAWLTAAAAMGKRGFGERGGGYFWVMLHLEFSTSCWHATVQTLHGNEGATHLGSGEVPRSNTRRQEEKWGCAPDNSCLSEVNRILRVKIRT